MLHSAAETNTGLTVHFLHGDEIGRRERSQVDEMVEGLDGRITWHRVDVRLLAGLPDKHPAPPSVWYRLLLPDLVDVDRVIYIDGDAIVIEPLAELWGNDLEGSPIGAVTNVLQDQVHEQRLLAIGISEPRRYFNSGVLLMDLSVLRAESFSRVSMKVAGRMHGELSWTDQDVLNLVLGSRRHDLHPRWNCMNSLSFFPWSVEVFGEQAHREACESPAVRHFEGPSINKPWHPECERPMKERYAEHRAQTPWPDGGPRRRTAERVRSWIRARRSVAGA